MLCHVQIGANHANTHVAAIRNTDITVEVGLEIGSRLLEQHVPSSTRIVLDLLTGVERALKAVVHYPGVKAVNSHSVDAA